MDLYCQNCGEPVDVYHVYNDMGEDEKKNFLSGKGCNSCNGVEVIPKDRPFSATAMATLLDVLGDDIDGVAAELEDLRL